ncbi:LpqB family beta-propeller domain-containing protein [Micromonospora sp. NPDC051006]|uniref:LpqB family beta-propeller domain-containing protein n=1 Tax=Micromonospora sp. NPDC051006 TaxID=3364283 RepID=UPI0037AF1E4A
MRRRFMAGALCGALAVAAFTGCGIPERSDVQIDERREPAAEPGSVNGRPSEPPSRASSGADAAKFVANFLAAAAGEPDRAYYRVKQFIAPEAKGKLQEKQGSEVALTVVRPVDRPVFTGNSDGTTTVRIVVQQLGLLRTDGVLVPPVSTETQYEFKLRSASPAGPGDDGGGLFLLDPPNVLLLSDTALRDYYQGESIYFWNTARTQLVPDQRYLPLAVPAERRLNEVVKWLVGGPSDWLRPGVVGLPDRTEMINNATGGNGRWEVNLDMSSDDRARVDQLVTQLAWSLPELDGQLELKIRNNPAATADLAERRRSDPLYPLRQGPQRFGVYEGSVRPLDFTGESSGPVPVKPEENRNVVSAGFARAGEEVLAALVVKASGRQRLSIGAGANPVTLFAKSTDHGAFGRPVWLRAADPQQPQGLVVADGKLYRFNLSGQLTQVVLNLPAGEVTAVAASLDGQRIALIAGGALYVAAVNLDGGAVAVGPPRRVVTSLTGLSAVDWGGEDRLFVAGSGGRSAINEITVDGAVQTPIADEVGAKVTHLSAYPTNPTVQVPAGAFMYEANGVAYRSNPLDRIQPEQVLDVAPPPTGVRPGNPSAPFFLY